MTSRSLFVPAAVLVLSLAVAAPARAELAVKSLVSQGDARAGWINTRKQSSVELFVRATSRADLGDAAYVELEGFRSVPPATPPSYDFRASVTGPSGGSPRLVMRFGDTGQLQLRPLSLVAGRWTRQFGSNDWDSYGGTCGYRPQEDYVALLRCHGGARVTAVQIVNDSGWVYPGANGVRMLVDNVSYDGETISNEASGVLGAVAESPDFRKRVNVTPVSGEVEVKPPGDDFVPLAGTNDLPVKGLIDATDGTVTVRSEDPAGQLQSGRFSGGVFQVLQPAAGAARGLTEILLKGGDFESCDDPDPRARSTARPKGAKKPKRKVLAKASRRHQVKGRASTSRPRGPKGRRKGRSSASGATWVTTDRCDGTLTQVRRGTVTVSDTDLKRSVVLRAGERYLARLR